jgi:protein TonB
MKNFFQNQDFQLDEVLFEHRNQNYGAYVLRHEADKILTKSLFVGVFLFAAIAATPFVINSFKNQKVVETTFVDPFVLVDVTKHDVPPVTQVKPIAPEVTTIKYIIPTPAKDPIVQSPLPSISDIKNTHIGFVDAKGTPPTISVAPPVNVTPPTLVDPVKPVVGNSIPNHVDIEAKFSTGIDGFRNGMIQNFDTTDFDGIESTMKTTITFIVEKDGTSSYVKANGVSNEFNQEAIKTLKSIRGKWTPAKLNGEIVRSYFSFPISMKFE